MSSLMYLVFKMVRRHNALTVRTVPEIPYAVARGRAPTKADGTMSQLFYSPDDPYHMKKLTPASAGLEINNILSIIRAQF